MELTDLKKYFSTIIFLVILVLVMGGTVLASYNFYIIKNKQVAPTPTPQIQTPMGDVAEQLTIKFENDDVYWKAGTIYALAATLDSLPNQIPNAIQLVITFDPQIVEIQKVDPGNMWTKTNVLNNKIDNKNGKIELVMGQGFDAEPSNSANIALITFKLLKSGSTSTTFNVATESAVAQTGVNHLINIVGIPYTKDIID